MRRRGLEWRNDTPPLRLRAAEAGLPAEAQEARKQAKLASARRYREKWGTERVWRRRRRGTKGGRLQRGSPPPLENGLPSQKKVDGRASLQRPEATTRVATMSAFEQTPGPNDNFYPPTPISPDVSPPADFAPCTIPDHLGENFSNHIDFTRLGNKRYWVLFWPRMPAGMYSLKTDVLVAAQEAGAAAARPGVLESYNGWHQVWAAWAQHCWVRHTRCSMHPNACCDGQCPDHPPPTNPEAIKVAKRGSVKQEGGGEPAKRIKSEAPSSLAPRRRAVRRHPPAVTISDDNDTPKAPLYDPDTPPERNRRHGQVDEVTPASPSPAAVGGGIRRIEDTRATHVSRGPLLASAVPSSSASAVPSSATPSSVSSLSASTAAPSIMGALAAAPSTVGASAAVAGLASGPDASWMHGLNDRALRVALRNDPFFVGTRGKIFHSRDQAFDEVSEGPVQVVVGWEAATELAVELVRERAARKGKEKEKGASMDVDGA
ncbi:hypothetical protein C8F04DRAFT_1186714 [Mycena alexandri]|uniref:Uncharacterized protein n=1 Tax=Mycena alexandri TaxID=1745969 RepID=A0AAD6WZP9_9AGAR|nr:hypothetical protein C8F04DRAFT_1186714 [Mycena alexandri]